MSITDADAINRLKRRDISGLEALVYKYQFRAVKTAFLVTGEQSIAEDVVQDAFLRVYERANQFDNSRPFEPWFLRIVVNDALKAIRHRARHISLDSRIKGRETTVLDHVADSGPDAQEKAEKIELQRDVRDALAKLNPSHRAAIILKYYVGLTDLQIAEQQNLHPGTIKKLLHRARGKLKLLLGPAYKNENSDYVNKGGHGSGSA